MIKVHIWDFRGLKTAMGHASMHVGPTVYVSWWPESEDRDVKIPGTPIYSVDHIQGQSFFLDRNYEGADRHSVWDASRTPPQFVDGRTGDPVSRDPDHTILLDGLDERRILDWWRKFNTPGRKWSTLGQNCATTVGRGLMIGGADDYALGASGWWHSWNTIWQPNDVLRYAHEVRKGLAARRSRQAAVNLIRRFCRSPLGFTSITMSLDEKGLAQAIYNEVGGNSVMIRNVFEELDDRRNTDADDVAEIYVNLLRTKKGPPLAAVKRDTKVKDVLVKVLDQGWTSAGEKKCIDFLKALR